MNEEASGRPLTSAQIEQRRDAGVRHGARSGHAVSRRSAYEKQRLCKPRDLVQADLTQSGRYWLDSWAKVAAEVYLYEQWIAEHGLLDEQGSPAGFMASYYAARNAMGRLFVKLEPHLVEAMAAKRGQTSMVLAMQRRNGKR